MEISSPTKIVKASSWCRPRPSQNIPEESLEQAGVTGAAEQEEAQEAGLADLLIGKYVLPFEAVSVLLLAALIGALALVRPRTSNPGVSGSEAD